jgi:flagellar biogenesis protein FliO
MLVRAMFILTGALGAALAFVVALAYWAHHLWRRS